MNETIRTQLQHRTVRDFEDRLVPLESVQRYLEVFNRTATSNGLQSYSIIRITDPQLKHQISQICRQPYVLTAPELVIFVVDSYRNSLIAQAKGYSGEAYASMDYFFQGVSDVYLGAQNMVTAIESEGLGTVYFGSILNDVEAMIELLQLPKLTLPILGLGFGYPKHIAPLKPRMPLEFKVSDNTYNLPENMMAQLSAYDQELHDYYVTALPNAEPLTYTEFVRRRYETSLPERTKIMQIAQKQGFHL